MAEFFGGKEIEEDEDNILEVLDTIEEDVLRDDEDYKEKNSFKNH